MVLIFNWSTPTTCKPSMNLPTLDHASYHSQQWVTPEMCLNSIGKGFLGYAGTTWSFTVQQEGFPPRSHLCPQITDSHSPHACPTSRVYTFTFTQSIDCYTSLSRASTTGWIRNSQSSVAATGLPPGELTSPTYSLTWRELLIGLTTYFFYPHSLTWGELFIGLTTCLFNTWAWQPTSSLPILNTQAWWWKQRKLDMGTVMMKQYIGNP